MVISKIGNMHVKKMCSNQDFYLVTDRMKLLVDGCSAGQDSDFGTRLFCKLFDKQKNKEDPFSFEKNVESVFEKMLGIFNIKLKSSTKKEEYEFIVNNFLFTILVCFETDDSFIVKFLGDGYIITENLDHLLSYIKIYYGPCPPYFAYNYVDEAFKAIYKSELTFRTYEFKKSEFVNVGLASDGIEPFVFDKSIKSEDKKKFDRFLLNEGKLSEERNRLQISNLIQRNSLYFADDTTILF